MSCKNAMSHGHSMSRLVKIIISMANFYYASNLELSHKNLHYLLTSVTTRPLRRAVGSLLQDPGLLP